MNGHPAVGARVWARRCLLALLLTTLWTGVGWAQTTVTIVRVEEDWELIVGEPDAVNDAPQITTAFSPQGSIEGLHAVFDVNAQGMPVYQPGGLQLQLWDGEVPLSDRRFPNGNVLSQTGEAVYWTHAMEINDGLLQFEIVNGSSSTWGSFGGQGYLKASVATKLTDLNSYCPEISVAHSGVGFSGHRVTSLILKRIRGYTDDGTEVEIESPWVIHPRQ